MHGRRTEKGGNDGHIFMATNGALSQAALRLELRDQSPALPYFALGSEAGRLGLGNRLFVAGRFDPVRRDDLVKSVETVNPINCREVGQRGTPIQPEHDDCLSVTAALETMHGDAAAIH
jgi:hypothetical protein